MSFFLSEFTRSIKTTGLKTYVSNGKNFKMASNKSGMLCPDASTNLGPSLQCELKKNSKSKVKFKNSLKENLRRWKIGIGQNDFVSVTHFGQGMEQVRWQDDWNSFQTSHFFFNAENSCFSAGVFIFGFATQWLFTNSRNLPIRSLDLCLFHNSQQRPKVNMNIRSRITCLLWIFFNFTVTCYFLFILPISGPILSVDG